MQSIKTAWNIEPLVVYCGLILTLVLLLMQGKYQDLVVWCPQMSVNLKLLVCNEMFLSYPFQPTAL